MSVILSKIKNVSEANKVPGQYVTRTITVAVFAIYFYKVGSPYVSKVISKYLQKSKKKCDLEGSCSSDNLISCVSTSFKNKSENNFDSTGNKLGDGLQESWIINSLRKFHSITGVNVSFVIQLMRLLRIMIPGFKSFEALVLLLHTLTLISRTFLSIYVARLEGEAVKFIVRRDVRSFSYIMVKWLLIALPATFVNSSLRFLENQLALSFRTRLVHYGYELYFKNDTYYSVTNLDARLENPDHYLTEDITNFSQRCAHLYSSVTKPLLDLCVTTYTLIKMAHMMGTTSSRGPIIPAIVMVSTHGFLRLLSPKFGVLVAEEARRSGFLRFIHSRIITNAEEIAFYKGHEIELQTVRKAYQSMTEQKKIIFKQRLWYVILEQFLMKYVWSALGMIMIGTPVIRSKTFGNDKNIGVLEVSERTQYMTTAKNILVAGGDAAERLMSSYKELIELTGYTRRVYRLFTVFEQVNSGKYQRPFTCNSSRVLKDISELITFSEDGFPIANGTIIESKDRIELENVPIITPNFDVVVPTLSLVIENDMHLLITGPNGCGKSSLFRILAGLWPIFSGRLEKPSSRDMFYIPQRPYMSLGTLRDQVIYPDTLEDMQKKAITDEDLEIFLDMVYLKHIVTREGGWDTKSDWKDVLSGGEKQRMGVARLFYHKPKFALLDECTSAVSIDVESHMYQTTKDLGISLITISHRPTLWKFHTHILKFDGQGNYTFGVLDKNQLKEASRNSS